VRAPSHQVLPARRVGGKVDDRTGLCSIAFGPYFRSHSSVEATGSGMRATYLTVAFTS
jgi:hypothetical protein